MRLPARSVFVRLSLFSLLLIAAVLVSFYFAYLLPARTAAWENLVTARLRNAFALSAANISSALKTRDDLALLAQIESLMKLDDVRTVYLLDRAGTVLCHDRTAEWGRKYADERTRAVLAAGQRPLVQRTAAPAGFLFSVPVTPAATLVVGVSSAKLDAELAALRNNFIVVSGIILIAVACLLSLYASGSRARFARFARTLSTLAPGERLPTDASGDEFAEIGGLVNGLVTRMEKTAPRTDDTSSSSHLQPLFGALAQRLPAGVMVLGRDNRVIFMDERARELSGCPPGETAGRHVLELVTIPGVLAALKSAAARPGVPAQARTLSAAVTALAVPGSANIAGTVVTFE